MVTCYDCHKPISDGKAKMARICHKVVYLCPDCYSVMGKHMVVVGKVECRSRQRP